MTGSKPNTPNPKSDLSTIGNRQSPVYTPVYTKIVRVLLAEDHTIVRKGLRSLLEGEADIEVVGEAEEGRETLRMTRQLLPDVVLMDISMPGLNGLEATRQIKKAMPSVNVVILTRHANEEYVLQILQAGASGYVLKRAAPTELLLAIRAAHRGEFFLSPAISREVIEEYVQRAAGTAEDGWMRLTDREREVLQLIAEGHTSGEIGVLLTISEQTVRTHRGNLMDKLDIHSTAELTQYAIRKGVISLDP